MVGIIRAKDTGRIGRALKKDHQRSNKNILLNKRIDINRVCKNKQWAYKHKDNSLITSENTTVFFDHYSKTDHKLLAVSKKGPSRLLARSRPKLMLYNRSYFKRNNVLSVIVKRKEASGNRNDAGKK